MNAELKTDLLMYKKYSDIQFVLPIKALARAVWT